MCNCEIKITEDDLSLLRAMISGRMSVERFEHTLGVERAAASLGEKVMPERVNELRAAALLHDVTKELELHEHLSLIDECNNIDKNDRCTEAALHSFSAVAVIIKDFSKFATTDILNAVMFHTLGDPSMNLFAEIIYLSDYIEDGRTYSDCVEVRTMLANALYTSQSTSVAIRHIHNAVLDTIERTVKSVIARGKSVDPRTLNTKIAIQALI